MAQISTYSFELIVSAGTEIKHRRLIGRVVSALIVDDITLNTGFEKIRGSDTVVMTDGSSFFEGQKVTIILG